MLVLHATVFVRVCTSRGVELLPSCYIIADLEMDTLATSNISDTDNSSLLLMEFPYWQPTLAITLVNLIIVVSIISFFVYLPLL